MNTPVSFEIAKLLKEKGFKPIKLFGYISKFYNPNTKRLLAYGRTGRTDLSKAYFAPTIAEVVMWLYENHGVWISVYTMDKWLSNGNDKEQLFDYSLKQMKLGLVDISKKPEEFNSPTEAYEAAIEYTLNNLI